LVGSYQDKLIITNKIGKSMPRKEQGWITFQTSEEERKILEEFSKQSQRTKTEILRELVRGLNKESAQQPSLPTQRYETEEAWTSRIEVFARKKPLKVSSRNILKGIIKRVVTGAVNTEVTLEIVHKVELTSIITRVSADELGLSEGTEAYAVIKSNDIVIARD
jgi:molybdopterin-binding protein